MDTNRAKELLNSISHKTKDKTKKLTKTPGFGWEIGAYGVRTICVGVPAAVIMSLEGTWVKNGLGLMATILIIALFIIYRKPIKAAANYAPGVIPFSIFMLIGIFFNTTAASLLTIGVSGLTGSILAIPLHAKYLSKQNTESDELQALRAMNKQLK